MKKESVFGGDDVYSFEDGIKIRVSFYRRTVTSLLDGRRTGFWVLAPDEIIDLEKALKSEDVNIVFTVLNNTIDGKRIK